MRDRSRRSCALGIVAAACLAAGGAAAEPPPPEGDPTTLERVLAGLKDNPLGSFSVKLRPRYEYAKIDGSDPGHAFTLRAAIGFGSRTWKGFSFFVEGEGIASADRDWYFDGTRRPNGRSFIPDPPGIDLNQGYVHYERTDWTTNLRAGRQRILLDDQRFVGNVGWRQNEQTFDAALVSTGLGRRDLRLTYAYLFRILRVFGDAGPPPTRDFDSTSHAVNVRWSGLPQARVTGFAYLLDFDEAPLESSNSYGLRVAGALELDSPWRLDYSLSYAFQTDGGDNPRDYEAHYAWVEGALAHEALGRGAVGFELLGSDGGRASFRTPLGTLHKFNGLADAFLDNGGPDGLRDLFVRIQPELPWRLGGELAFHQFWADEGGRDLGWELDAYLSRPLTRYVTVLAATAYFRRTTSRADRPGVFRAWLQFEIDF
ncbi:MAG: alginate export family protein [Myxococcota bacterium]|nr:alginate export family protein [Myxococcota bacterium]